MKADSAGSTAQSHGGETSIRGAKENTTFTGFWKGNNRGQGRARAERAKISTSWYGC